MGWVDWWHCSGHPDSCRPASLGQQMNCCSRSRGTGCSKIHVLNPRVIEIAMVGNTRPNLAIDMATMILYLQGQWLYDPDIYGAPPRDDEGDELFNGLPAPHSFPCSEFTITRLPHSGEVLRIQIVGNYLQPEPAVEALKSEHEFQPSELFSGSIDDLVMVMEREHKIRRAANKPIHGSGEVARI